MSANVPGTAYRQLLFGTKVSKSAVVLPATAFGALFTVTVGRVIIMGLIGEVTTVADATATTVKVTHDPTAAGTTTDLTTATAITSKEVGSLVGLPAAAGGALVVTNAGGAVQMCSNGMIVPEGSLGITTSATNTGALMWDLYYVPLDAGATVAAA